MFARVRKRVRQKWTNVLMLLTLVTQFGFLDSGFICRSDPCLNGICIDYLETPSDYSCYCINGFTGYACEINWDECRSSPCLNGGVCYDGIASFNCTCPANFTGSLCQFDLATTCGSHLQCQNNGTCDYTANNYSNLTASVDDSLVGHCMCLPGFTGYHCEIETVNCSSSSNGCLNGECVFDNTTLTEHCQCEPGFRGKFCQIDIDECASAPCHNEGVCLDKINGFDCACPFGFTGRLCENKLKICEENPCKHGFCLEEEENKKTCYCVPDFHGEFCELQYNECEPEPQCHNGGTCIDGVGGFNCSCPPTYYGPVCQCTTTNTSHNNSEECQAFLDNTTLTVTPSSLWWTSLTPTPTQTPILPTTLFHDSEGWSQLLTATMIDRSPSLEIETIRVPEPTQTVSTPILEYSTMSLYYSESPEMTAIVRSELALTSKLTPGSSLVQPTPGPSIELESSIEVITQTLTGRLEPSVFEPYPSETAEPGETDLFTPISTPVPVEEVNETSTVMFTLMSTIELVTTGMMPLTPVLSPTIVIPIETVSLPESEQIGTTLSVPDPTATLMYSDFVSTHMIKSPATVTEGVLEPSEVTALPSEVYSASDLLTSTKTAILSIVPVPGQSDSYQMSATPTPSAGLPQPEESSQFISSTLVPVTSQIIIIVSSFQTQQPQPEESTQFPIIETTEIEVATLPAAATATTPILILPTRTIEPVSSTVFLSGPFTTPDIGSTSTGESESQNFTTSLPPASDSCQDYCQNNAKCTPSEKQTPICHCPFKYTGDKCEQLRDKIQVPSFAGNSFMVYNLSREEPNTMIDTSLTMATLVRNGLLLYTGILEGVTYALIFVQDGHICLHFSCGEQSMSFVETRTRVDTGFNFTLNFKMEMLLSEFNEIHCSCRLTVNGSYTMGGEQLVGKESYQFQRDFPKMFIGGVDPELKSTQQKHDEMIGVLDGFRGCLYQLMLSKVEQDMYDAAVDGHNIGECSNFVCTINPCFGESICIPSHQFPEWECKCPPLFEGVRCQIPVCSHNPCLNDGTCAAYLQPNVTTQISMTETEHTSCNCKLGFMGSKCESRMNVTQPSFRPKPNYASYISYNPMLNLKDWFQLKFHFLTRNMTQFGLIAFIGGRNPYYYHYGHTDSVLMEHQHQQEPSQVENPIETESPEVEDFTSNEIMQENAMEAEEPDQSLDFYAISFLQGYLAVTWNLGSGVQRIVTPYRIDTRLSIHTLYTGRDGNISWLKVDGMSNVSGSSPGKYKRLDTGVSELYVGGYETFRMEGLPYDLSLHEGFEGCVFDLGFRVKNKLFLPTVTSGRNVGNCFSDYYISRNR